MRWLQAVVSEISFSVPKDSHSTKERLAIWASPVQDAKVLKGQKHIMCEERWRDLDLFSLATRR